MATQLLKTVKPSGGDYTSLEACLNANEQDLVVADQYFDVEISGTWSAPDTTSAVVHLYTTDATRYINIYTVGDARHDGTYGGYSLEDSGQTDCLVLNFDGLNMTVDGLCFKVINTSSRAGDGLSIVGEVNNVVIKNCIFYNSVISSKRSHAIRVRLQASGLLQVYNNIGYGFSRNSGSKFFTARLQEDFSLDLYNNTAYDCGVGFSLDTKVGYTDVFNISNNISYNSASSDYDIEVSAGIITSNNLSSDATSPDSSYRNKTLTFIDTTDDTNNADFHLTSTDYDAIGKGVDLSSVFTTDIDGETRVNWDLGADESEHGVVSPTTQSLSLILQSPVIVLISNPTVTPNVQTLTSTLLISVVGAEITPEVQNVSLAQYAPAVVGTALITPDAQTLSTTLHSPSLIVADRVTPALFDLSVTLHSPTVVIVEHETTLPSVFATMLTLETATVYIQSDVVILPDVFQVASILQGSEVIGTANISVDVLAMTLTFEDIVPQSKVLPDTFTFNVTQYSPQLHWTGVVDVAVLTIDTELGDITVELDFARRTVRILKTTIEDYLGMKTLALKPDNKIGVIKPDNIAKIVISDNKTKILQSDNITKII